MLIGNSDDIAKEFAKSIHHLWGLGDKSKDNSVLLFLSIDDRKWYELIYYKR